ncbi:MAG: carboxypeptidase-like regulatory domain-containing protein [Saprospiraceae bacterium]
MKYSLLPLFLFLLTQTLIAQTTVSGKVVDEAGGPIAYAHIVIPGTTCGALSDDDGTFDLRCDHQSVVKDSVKVSYLGYLTGTVAVSSLNDERREIVLVPASQQLSLVSVVESRKSKSLEYRFEPPSRRVRSWYQKDVTTTYQVATRIENRKNIVGYLEEIKFHIGRASSDQSTLRLFFYALDETCGCPGKPLNAKDIVLGDISKNWNTVDLLPYIVDLPATDFFVGFEWLGIRDKSDKKLDFSIGMVPYKQSGYLWEKEGGREWAVKKGLGGGRPVVRLKAIY